MAYDNDAYMKSLAKSSADVKRSVTNALSEVTKQKALAQKASAKIGGVAQSNFGESRGRLGGDLASLGLSGLSEATAAGFDEGVASYGRVGGLMHKGFGERATRQGGQVRGISRELGSDINQKRAEYTSQRQREDKQMAFQRAEADRARALQLELARRQEAMQAAAMAADERRRAQDKADQAAAWNASIGAAMKQQAGAQARTHKAKVKAKTAYIAKTPSHPSYVSPTTKKNQALTSHAAKGKVSVQKAQANAQLAAWRKAIADAMQQEAWRKAIADAMRATAGQRVATAGSRNL